MLVELQQKQHILYDEISCSVFVLREFLWLYLWHSLKVALYTYFDCHFEPRPKNTRIIRITKWCCKDLARRQDCGTLNWEGWSVTFKTILGIYTTVPSQESQGNSGRHPVGILVWVKCTYPKMYMIKGLNVEALETYATISISRILGPGLMWEERQQLFPPGGQDHRHLKRRSHGKQSVVVVL